MKCQSLAVQASLLQKVRGYGGEVYYGNNTNKGLPRSRLSTCTYREFEINISEDRGTALGGSGSPGQLRARGKVCGPSLQLPPQHHLRSPQPHPTAPAPAAHLAVPPPRKFRRRFCRCRQTTDMNTVLCRMKWLNIPGAQHIHLFSCFSKKGEDSLRQTEGISLML